MYFSTRNLFFVFVLVWIGITGPNVQAVKFRYIEFEILRLPVWRYYEAEEDIVGYYPGGGLWPEGCLPEKGVEYVIAANEELRKSRLQRKYPDQDLDEDVKKVEVHNPKVRYLVDKNSGLPQLPASTNQINPANALPAEVMHQIFAYKPAYMLTDPQDFLQGQRVNDMMRFLELQSERAKFDIYTLVLSGNQTLPDNINLTEVHKKWFGDDYAALMLYHVNSPDKTQLILGSNVPEGTAAQIAAQVIPKAFAIPSPEDQLEELMIELSIQLYSLEFELERPEPVDVAVVEESEVVAPAVIEEVEVALVEPSVESTPIEPMEVVYPVAVVAPVKEAKPTSGLTELAKILVSFAIIGFGLMFWRFRDEFDNDPVTFSISPNQCRLGGVYSGGTFYGVGD